VGFERGSKLSRIGERAFCNCCSLASICIPPGLLKIGGGAFLGTILQDISMPYRNSNFTIINHFLLCLHDNSIVAYYGRESTVTLPSGVEKMGPACFEGHPFVSMVVCEPDCRLSSFAGRDRKSTRQNSSHS
jgi:hypothetical protein